ncbi:hypothetical protein [Faecalispora anaeroviscerum]|uniref:hypothetical protein n=1 Tax=Faecalispora anaeroviscerum TaxID=2991836 RepID=UPI0024BA4944|nr:hypothetical protein [Faecalispora anaeroviscerum]
MIVSFSVLHLKQLAALAASKEALQAEAQKQLYDYKPLAIGLRAMCLKTGQPENFPLIRSLIIDESETISVGEKRTLICLDADCPTEIKLTEDGLAYFGTILEQFFDVDFLTGLEEYLRKYNLNERRTYDAIRGSSIHALVEWFEDFTNPKPEYDRDRCKHVAGMIELELQRRKEGSSHD